MKILFKLNTSGFTLIELAISFAIIAVVLATGIPAYRRFDEKQKVIQQGKDISSLIRVVQKRAQSGEKPETGCSKLEGWKLKKITTDTTFEMIPICDGGTEISSSKEAVPLSSEIVLNQDNFEITFEALTGRALSQPTSNILTIENSKGNYSFGVEIDQLGIVRNIGVIEP